MTDGVLHIVVLEDVKSDAELAMLQLENLEVECQFKWLDSGDAFEEFLADTLPDLVISDFRLPKYDGLKALRKLREKHDSLPFIFLTGTLEEENAIEAIRAGATDFILKKHIEQLPAAVLRALRETRIEAARRREQSRFGSLIQHSDEGLIILDHHANISFVSLPTYNLLQRSDDQLDDLEFSNLIHPNYRSEYHRYLQRIQEGNSSAEQGEFQLRIDSHRSRWFQISMTDQRDVEGVEGIVLNIADIHVRKLAEQQVELSEMRFRALVEESDDINLIIQYNSAIKYCSESLERILGLKPEEAIKSKLLDYIHPEDADRLKLEIQTLKSISKVHLEPFRIKDTTGDWRWIRAVASNLYDAPWIKGIVINGSDQTDLIKKTRELQLSNERYTYASKAARDLIYDWDLVTNEVQRENETMHAFFGYELSEIEDTAEFWRKIVHPDDVEASYDYLQGALSDPHRTFCDNEYRILRKDRSTAYVYDKAYIVRDEQGKAVRLVGALRDITDTRTREIHLRLATDLKNDLNQPGSVKACLENALETLATFTHVAMAEAWLAALDGKGLNLSATWAHPDADLGEYLPQFESISSFDIGLGLPGDIFKTERIQYWPEIHDDKRFMRRKQARKAGLKGAIGIPIVYQNHTVAVILLFTKEPERDLRELNGILSTLQHELGSDLQRKRFEFELNTFFDLSPDLLCIAGFDGFFKKVNPAFTNTLGYSVEELLAKPYVEFVHPDDRVDTSVEAVESVQRDGSSHFENRYLTKDGGTIWLSWASYPAPEMGLIYAVARDITDQKMFTQQLKATNEQLKEAHKIAQIGYWQHRLKDNKANWNDGMFRIWGQDPETFEPTLEAILPLVHPDDRKNLAGYHIDQLRSNQQLTTTYRIKVSGQEKWVQERVHLEEDEEGNSIMKGVSQNITERMRYQNKIESQNEQLRDIAWTQSHRVRAPLSRMMSILNMIEEFGSSPEEMEKWLKYLSTSVNELDTIIEDITKQSYPLLRD